MTFRTLRAAIPVAFGAGALAGAGQLGFGYGLGILRVGRTFDSATVNQWAANLTWTAWISITAALVGAAVAYRHAHLSQGGADRTGRQPATDPPAADPAAVKPAAVDPAAANPGAVDPGAVNQAASGQPPAPIRDRPEFGVRLAIAAGAALGAALVVPLSMLPARTAQVPSVEPVLVIGITAALGAVVGIVAALGVLGPRPLRWNLAGVVGGGWLLALISVLPSLDPADPLPTVRLGVFDPAWLAAGSGQRLAVVTMPALALVAGALTGGLARWRGYPRHVVATCGAAGAGTLGLAYLIAGPGTDADRYQAAPYWGALAAIVAGLLGSVLAATVRWPILAETPQHERGEAGPADPGAAAAGSDTGGPAMVAAAAVGAPATTDTASPAVVPPTAPAPTAPALTAPAPTAPTPTAPTPTVEDFWPATPAGPGPGRTGQDQPAETAGTRDAPPERSATPTGSGRSWRRLLRQTPTGGAAGPASDEPSATQPGAEEPDPGRAARTQPGDPEPEATSEAGDGQGPGSDTSTAGKRKSSRLRPGGRKQDRPRPDPAAEQPDPGEPAAGDAPDRTKPGRETPGRAEPADPASPQPADDALPRQRERRGRGRARTEPELPAQDAEYVDWVSGLRGNRSPRNVRPEEGGPTSPLRTPGGHGPD